MLWLTRVTPKHDMKKAAGELATLPPSLSTSPKRPSAPRHAAAQDRTFKPHRNRTVRIVRRERVREFPGTGRTRRRSGTFVGPVCDVLEASNRLCVGERAGEKSRHESVVLAGTRGGWRERAHLRRCPCGVGVPAPTACMTMPQWAHLLLGWGVDGGWLGMAELYLHRA